MSNSERYAKELRKYGALNPSVPPIVQAAVNCINTEAVTKMKIAIAVSELTTFASHLRKPIQFNEKLVVPTNSISTIFGRSGVAKDSSVNAVRTALSTGYDMLKTNREKEAKVIAQEKAINAGEEAEDFYKYMRVLRPLMPELGTEQGMTQHFAMLAEGNSGAGMISTNEIGSDLLAKKDMPLILTLLAKAYDLGNVPATVVKDDLNQVAEIKGFPVNALLFGTESVVLYDPKVKGMFIQSFSSQFARRANFSFNPEALPIVNFEGDIDAELDYEEEVERQTMASQAILEDLVGNLVLTTTNEPLAVSPQVSRLYRTYLKYNKELATLVPKVYPLAEISRKHYQWKTLKFAAVLAIYDNSDTIEVQHFVDAINTLELFADDLMLFERELIKESYEQFADFMHTIAEDGKAFLSIHNLRKLAYVSSSAEARMNDLAKSATSYDTNGIYTVSKDGIHYECLQPTIAATPDQQPFNTSFLEINDNMSEKFAAIYQLQPAAKQKQAKEEYKQYLGSIIKSGYQAVNSSFADIAIALSSNAAISNYLFTDGIRGKDNLINSTNWLLFDIDTSTLSMDSVHFILQDINHHLVRGSDNNNDYKYHLAIELASTLVIEGRMWKPFMKSVASYLGIQHDELPQSQVMFCYGAHDVLSVTDQSPLDIKDHLLAAQASVTNGPTKELTTSQKKSLLANAFTTFQPAFDAMDGEGSRKLIWAAYEAKGLGMPNEAIVDLLHEISDYWDSPYPQSRLDAMCNSVMSW